jgi:outer membrane protein assembly factor BamA
MIRRATGPLMAVLALCASEVQAQDTREAVLDRQRAEKAATLQPYEPGRLEKLLLVVDAENPLARIAPYNGFFVEYGYEHKPTGSGIGFGGGFRHDLFGRRARVELEAGISFKNYRMVRADFSLPYLADDRVEVGVEATDHHQPQEDFYGLGLGSTPEERVSYLIDLRQYEARALYRPSERIEIGARFGRLSPELGPGTDKGFPSIELRFTDDGAPGLDVQPAFSYQELSAALDSRDQRGNARQGGYYTASWRRYGDSDLDRYGFRTIDVRAQQFFPIFDKKRVFALQARLVAAAPREAGEVPFYFKPTLGGSYSLRGVSDYRYRDNNVFHVNAEYRWEAFSILDMALFADWGTVAARAADIDLGDMKRAYGIGFRFNTAKTMLMRVDIATGSGEGLHYWFKFSKMF